MLKSFLLITFVSLGFACGSQAQSSEGLKVQNGQKVAFLGDSITQFGWQRPGGYVRLVAAGLESAGAKIVPVPAGISGNTSKDMLGRLEKDVINQKPDWMTLSCGVNDVWHGPTGVELEPYKANITSIVDKAQAAGIKVMILTATVINENDNPNNQKLAAYNEFLRQLAKEKNLALADLNAAFWKSYESKPASTNPLTCDGVHMNPEGNMLMARGVLEGFGMSPAQLGKFEAAWRNSPDAASAMGNVQLSSAAPISLAQYNALNAVAKERKISVGQLQSILLFDALRVVFKAHDQDATLTPEKVQSELPPVFKQQVEALSTAGKK